jgi:cytochrome c-type biogenesis protein
MSWGFFGLFGAGLATFLSPCVLPLAPILVASWSTSGASKWARLFSTLWFALGFTLTFVLLGLSASAISAWIAPIKPFLFAFGATILALFALKMLGVINSNSTFSWLEKTIRLPDVSRRVLRSLAGFVFGLIFGLSWTPCVGPILGAVLTYVASQQTSPIRGAAMLGVFSLGISLPLLILAVASDQLKPWLARLRAWIPRIEYAMGVGLLIFSISLLNQARVASDLLHIRNSPVTAIDQSKNTFTLGAKTPGQFRMVFFYSENCPICHAMESYLPGFEKSCTSSIFKFSKVNVDLADNSGAAEHFQVRAVPTLSVFDGEGRELVHLVGYQTESRLREAARTMTGLICQESKSLEPQTTPWPQEDQACTVGKHC